MKNTNEISTEQRAYFAGLLDGEGCIYIDKDASSGYVSYSLEIRFSMTYYNILYEMKNLFGGNINKKDMSKRSEETQTSKAIKIGFLNPNNWKQQYHYTLHSKEAWVFLKMVEPYCKEKKEQVNTGIEFFNGNRPGSGRKGRSKEQVERCEYYYKKLQELKHIKNNDDSDLKLNNNQTNFSLFSEV